MEQRLDRYSHGQLLVCCLPDLLDQNRGVRLAWPDYNENMRVALLMFLVLLGYAAFLFLAFLLVSRIFTKRFSRFWRPCFYLCLLALVALMSVLPLSYHHGRIN